MKVLMVTPYVPDPLADHAVADTAAQLVPRLAEHVELTLFVPGLAAAEELPAGLRVAGVEVAPSATPATASLRRLFGATPAAVRKEWPRACTGEVRHFVRAARPDVVHFDYLGGASAMKDLGVPSVLTLHDYSAEVSRKQAQAANWWWKPYRVAEAARVRRFERHVAQQADIVFALSEVDRDALSSLARDVRLASPGFDIPSLAWSPPHGGSPILLFVGALWRPANAATAEFLIRAVMPRVWEQIPAAKLRLVGSRPGEPLRRLAAADPRVEVTGYLPNLEDAHRQANVVLAPSLVGGGILLKILRAMAIGCPVVTTSIGGSGVGAVDGDVIKIADTADDLATAALELLRDEGQAQRMGRRARNFIGSRFSWDGAVKAHIAAYGELAERYAR